MTLRIIIFSFIIVVALHSLRLFDPINNWIYDNYIILNQQKSYSNEIVIVSIDLNTIKDIGYWPFKRSLYTKAVKNIISGKPAVIGISLSFTQTVGSGKEDQELYNILKTFPNILIASRFQYKKIGKLKILVPEKNIFPSIKQGHITFTEKDVVRGLPPFKIVPAFAVQALKMYYQTDSAKFKTPDNNLINLLNKANNTNYSTSEDLLIDYKRDQDKFKRISFEDVLNNRVPADELKNKIVLIGVTDKYYSSIFATPYSRLKDSYTSTYVELQAQIIDSLLNFRNLKIVADYIFYPVTILLSIVFLFLIKSRNIVFQGIALILSLIGTMAASYLLFQYAAVWFPPALLMVSILTISGFSGYFTINSVDNQLITAINKLHEDENIPLSSTPANISHKIDILNQFMNIIVNDRHTIKAIINGVNNGIVVFNEEGKIIWTNGPFINMFKDSLVLESNIHSLIPVLDINTIISEIKKNACYRTELNINNIDLICVINPIYSVCHRYVAIFNDITELKELDRLKTDMVRMVSHELKSPLMSILLACENISDFEEREITLQSNQKITNSSTYMLNTINNFLNLNKLEANLSKPEITSINLADTIDKATELNIQMAENNRIIMNKEILHSSNALADTNLLEIVLNNLISNAIKYSRPESIITIKTEENDREIIIEVTDSGIGISENEINRVFDKFYRATNFKSNEIKGTGLGLSIVKKILDLHNSEITIKSELNKGTTVRFTLKKNI